MTLEGSPDTEHGSNYEKAKRTPKGFYYLKFMHTYKDLTRYEMSCRLDLAKELVAEDQGYSPYLLMFELKDIKYADFLRTEVYYVLRLGIYLGKLSISVTNRDDKYDVSIYFSERHIMSKTGRYNAGLSSSRSPYHPYDYDYKRNLRMSSRKWRKRSNHNSGKGDIKSER